MCVQYILQKTCHFMFTSCIIIVLQLTIWASDFLFHRALHRNGLVRIQLCVQMNHEQTTSNPNQKTIYRSPYENKKQPSSKMIVKHFRMARFSNFMNRHFGVDENHYITWNVDRFRQTTLTARLSTVWIVIFCRPSWYSEDYDEHPLTYSQLSQRLSLDTQGQCYSSFFRFSQPSTLLCLLAMWVATGH